MCRKIAWLLSLMLAFGVVVYANEATAPTAARHAVLDVNRIDAVYPAKLDLEKLGAEDAHRDRLGLPPRFAVPEQVSISTSDKGTWEDLGNGQMLWRLRILGSEGTNSLNLGFTKFKMSPGSRLMVYSADASQILRPFTAADNETHGQLWTPVVVTNDLIVELTVPKSERKESQLTLGWINRGYRGFGTVTPESYNKSGSCNLDVECLDAGDGWRNTMRAVGVMSSSGSFFCTGSLINDTAGDRKMYFITAAHCTVTAANAASLVVYWNYQNSFCRTPGSAASGAAGNGSLTQFHSGAIHRATYATSDVTLVELDDPAVSTYNHHWEGWNRATGDHTCTAAAPCAAIHHPSTDEKRITYVTVNTATTSYSGTASPGNGSHIWAKWAVDPPGPFTVPGVTEPGSSGSPLFDANRRFIGQLHGGPSSCGATGNNLSDYYGRFSVSWAGGGTSSTRVSNWLDAGATGATTTNGIDFPSGPCTPPAVPGSVSASAASPTQINVSWGSVSGASSYNVSRSSVTGGPYATAGSSATTSFSNTGLTCNTTYYYVVNSSNGICSSANSSQVSATTQACPVCTNTTEVEPNNSTAAAQILSGACNQISGTFAGDAAGQRNDYFRISLPAGATVTALLNGLSADYDVFILNSGGTQVASSENAGTAADTATYTNTGAAANVYVRVYRYAATQTTYQLRVSF